ncbi:SAG-related sequence [Besnoitia besnoiti]|uniref:SAG-related sequence n=1 Tax=Besnoitia besnoiti TaxID=94643 RepID=A0A2A9MMN3_BESBE|nr:SAG-related sequence [Besnoitia besnoiti]PFH36812.1 SAG-related sequence [Besnoitia besnoiti]
MSQQKSVFQLLCGFNILYATDGLQGSSVCPAETKNLAECKAAGADTTGTPKPVEIEALLSGTSLEIVWEKQKVDENISRTLTIPQQFFPDVDEEFVVGCLNSGANTAACQVTLTLAAKATFVEGKKVFCAHGESSNPTVQSMTVSEVDNNFTLVCGDKGQIVQTDYEESYCSPSEGKEAVTKFGGDYKTILPSYEQAWWSGDDGKSFTLTVPKEKVPRGEATFMIQCQKKSKKAEAKEITSENRKLSACSVHVTIQGTGPPSSSFASLSVYSAGHRLVLWVNGLLATVQDLSSLA